ncbi:MAG: motility protein A [Lachnospiraceae bacterium]|nr:motility protein A [Lachnospiraceae bacterium]
MDLTTIVGIIAGFALITFGIGIKSIGNFIDPQSILIVLGGTISGLVASYPVRVLKLVPKAFVNTVKPKNYDVMASIEQLQEMAIIARKNGLLALEDKANEAEDPFFKQGLMLIVDATAPEKVRELMNTDLENIQDRHGEIVEFFEKAAAYAPGFGLVGTLIGLINMLRSMSAEGGSDALALNMGVAMITTFYGSILCNLIFLPIAKKLAVRNEEEALCKRVIIEGILSIQAGENPTFLKEKLITFLPQYARDAEGKGKKGSGND